MRTESAFPSLLPEPAGWSGQLPESPPTLDQARRYCQILAQNHYENFHVVSWLFPRRLRPHLHAVYAYCRWADDLGDETGDAERSLWLLHRWEEELLACYQGRARHPVFVALRDTVERFHIPPEPFLDLLAAFRQDQVKKRYQDFGELLDYCRYSANPVGRLVLYVCGYRDRERQQLSDFTCTALQLANFWQDVWRDYQIGRIYLPLQDMMRHGYSEEELASRQYNERFARLLQELVERTWELFRRGLPLASQVARWLAVDMELFSRGGMEVLRLIERQNYDVLARRPYLTREEKTLLFASTALSRMFVLRKSATGK
ncbi:MAG TPA: squalene synthase HpnC [Candidatus Glassbacteria bacterium]|nr:squalene synthase HpnC [Candidatus Glassbacteria bacterium]